MTDPNSDHASDAEGLIEKIRALPPEKQRAVARYVALLSKPDSSLAWAMLSESAFADVWDNPDDAVYDED